MFQILAEPTNAANGKKRTRMPGFGDHYPNSPEVMTIPCTVVTGVFAGLVTVTLLRYDFINLHEILF